MKILGVDPGTVSGFATLTVPEDAAPSLGQFHIVPNGYQGMLAQLKWLEDVISEVDIVVMESFVLRRGGPMTSDQISPTYGIGVIETVAASMLTRVILRTPAENKSAVDNATLKRLELWGSGNNDYRHARDAVRVVVGHLKTSLHRPTLEKGWGDTCSKLL